MSERFCRLSEIDPGSVVAVDHPHFGRLAIYHTEEGVFATQDLCTHGNASLGDGWLEGTEIECPLHAGRFCVKSGRPTEAPAEKPLKIFKVEVENDWIVVSQV